MVELVIQSETGLELLHEENHVAPAHVSLLDIYEVGERFVHSSRLLLVELNLLPEFLWSDENQFLVLYLVDVEPVDAVLKRDLRVEEGDEEALGVFQFARNYICHEVIIIKTLIFSN